MGIVGFVRQKRAHIAPQIIVDQITLRLHIANPDVVRVMAHHIKKIAIGWAFRVLAQGPQNALNIADILIMKNAAQYHNGVGVGGLNGLIRHLHQPRKQFGGAGPKFNIRLVPHLPCLNTPFELASGAKNKLPPMILWVIPCQI